MGSNSKIKRNGILYQQNNDPENIDSNDEQTANEDADRIDTELQKEGPYLR